MNAVRKLLDLWQIRRDPVAWARSQGARVGEGCRLLGVSHATFGGEPWLVTLGDHVSISAGTRLLPHDGGVWVFRGKHPDAELFGAITVGSNVFIGIDVLVMPGVTIGDNVVIGARSVVTRDIPPGVVAVGSPCKPIKSIEEYWRSIEGRIVHTKLLPPAEKRRRVGAMYRP